MKIKNIFKSKSRIAIIAIIVVAIVFGITFPGLAHAGLAESIVRLLFSFIANIIIGLFSLFVSFGATFLNAMIDIGFSGTSRVIAEAGWHASLNVANMFFILIMVLIAFGTILRIEQFGVKKLLPKLIIIALLINFSLPISYIFIDFSNVTAKAFITNLGDSSEKIREQLVNSVKANILLLPKNCDEYNDSKNPETYSLEEYQKCTEQNKAIKLAQKDQTWIDIVVASIIACIFIALAAFVLIAAAMVLVIRILFLAILVILAPLAFICYIVPSLNKHWKEWWSNLLKWCFFAPIFMFFFALAIKIVNNFSSFAADSSLAAKPAMEGRFLSSFFAHTSNVIGYFLFLGLIMGGMIVAQKLGYAGADVAMKLANNAKKGALDLAKRSVTKPSAYLGAGALGLAGGVFGKTRLGGRLRAKSAQMKQSATQFKENKAYANLLKTMNDNDLLHEVETAGGSRKLLAIQEAKKRGLMRDEAGRETASKAINTMRSFGDEEGARSLEELRPDAIIDDEKRAKAMQRAFKEGTHKKWSSKVFESPMGKKIIKGMKDQLGSEFAKTCDGYTKETKDVLSAGIKDYFSDDFNEVKDKSGKETNLNMEMRNVYAKITGDVHTAFNDLVVTNKEKAVELTKKYIQGLDADKFSKLKNTESKELAGQYMTEKQVYTVGIAITNDSDKKIIMDAAEKFNKAVYNKMQISEAWGGTPPTSQQQNNQSNNTTDDIRIKTQEQMQADEQLRRARRSSGGGNP